ncbi:O-antigen ligase family protein [Gloeobacter kilaueensis]|uniref:O-antigen ligase-related domain-containing protein n=1 Tax=Gloeobacter kilaueensis (strain ATCC BAA-2537 / CCAP 1431/1 / ULC 316 / JS1) TaxID=1183438 RepID=U5QC80_GLOK1|nr:O-antigen ligase family protein [Gloeobacter kilaueensis]AGY56517.1 hypothetical protein GKIL_0270 [Gloeobacter kilaueensis JS1]
MEQSLDISRGRVGTFLSTWRSLSFAEKTVSVLIVLLPVWWFIGLDYIYLPLLLGVAGCELWRYGRIRLGPPRPEILAFLAFAAYVVINANVQGDKITGHSILSPLLQWGGGALLLWYIQSNGIRVRLKVVLWAMAILISEMLLVWAFGQFVLGEETVPIVRSLTGYLLDKGERYVEGAGSSNYLRLLDSANGSNFLGRGRFTAFIGHPEFAGQALACVCLLALSGGGSWLLLLGSSSLFLLLLTGTRSALVGLVVVVAIRYFFSVSKLGGLATLWGLVAIISFSVLSIPPITETIVDSFSGTVQSTGNFRRRSTEVRQLIYQRTIERLGESPLFGHGVPGRTVLPGYAPAQIGSHSFILGSLFYCSGIVGTILFVAFWTLFTGWLWQTRFDRPDCAVLSILMFTGMSTVVAFEISRMSIILLFVMISAARDMSTQDRI